MSDSLRDRIGKVLQAHPDQLTGDCCGGQGFTHVDQWAQHVADAVIAEMRQLMETKADEYVPSYADVLRDFIDHILGKADDE